MPSRRILTDSMVGLLIAAFLVIAALWVWQVCAIHAKEHGHDGVRPLFDFEGAQRTKDRAGGQGDDVRHAGIVSRTASQKHVRGGRS